MNKVFKIFVISGTKVAEVTTEMAQIEATRRPRGSETRRT
jgi:ribosomal protein L6P/L9E